MLKQKIASNEAGFWGGHLKTEEQSFSTKQLGNHYSLT